MINNKKKKTIAGPIVSFCSIATFLHLVEYSIFELGPTLFRKAVFFLFYLDDFDVKKLISRAGL